jgi:hypothetical protein
MEHHMVEQRRDLVGTVVARYGGENYMAVDVRLDGGQYRLLWPSDLEEISSSLRLGGACCSVGDPRVNPASYSPRLVEEEFLELRLDRVLRSSAKWNLRSLLSLGTLRYYLRR